MKFSTLKLFIIGLLLFPVCLNAKPLLWNMDAINKVKKYPSNFKIYKKVISKADKYCSSGPLLIIDKHKTYAPDNHYYCSIAPYWWPDENNPEAKYIHKDGEFNPEQNDYDHSKIAELRDRLVYLSIAYYWTANQQYKDSYMNLIIDWFINEATYMYPNFEYSQVVKGWNDNKGRCVGLVETGFFIDILDSYRLMQESCKIDKSIEKSFSNWIKQFYRWMLTSEFGLKEKEQDNNISTLYDIVIYDMAHFIGDKRVCKQIVRQFASKRLYGQISENGAQEAELVRANAYGYSIRNLRQIVDFCIMAENSGIRFYKHNRRIINSAFEWLLQYASAPEEFPYSQLSSFDTCVNNLYFEVNRLRMLSGGDSFANICNVVTPNNQNNIRFLIN